MRHEIYRQPPALLTRLRQFPSIPGSGRIIPGYVEKIPGYLTRELPRTSLIQAIYFWDVRRPAGNFPVTFPVERELGNNGRAALPIADCGVVAGEGFEPPTLGL